MTTLIKLGGAILDDAPTLDALAAAWKARSDAKDRWILVHGGGPQLDAALAGLGEPCVRVHGLRVTSVRAAERVQKTLDFVGAELTARLRDRAVHAVHIPAADRRLKAVRKILPGGGSVGRVGTVVHFDAASVAALVPPGRLAVVTPVGWDEDGPLNVNADEGALAVATGLRAAQLFLVTDVDGVRDAHGRTLSRLGPQEAKDLIAGGVAKGGMEPKLLNALDALRGGVGEVLIGDIACLADETRGTRIGLWQEVLA